MPSVGLPVASGTWGYWLRDVDGFTHTLDPGDDVAVLDGLRGLLMPPVDMRDRELPLHAGSQLQGVRIATREGDVPLHISAPNLAALVARHEALLGWVDAVRGTVAFGVVRPDGTERELICTYLGGLEGDETGDTVLDTWMDVVGTFRAHEPYWRDVTPTTRTYTLDPLTGTWFPMAFPILLAGSQLFRTVTEDNTGSAEAYPVFTITGPGTNPVLRNLTTGRYLGLSLALGAGDTLTVDMAPLVAVPIADSGGNSRFDARTAGSERWPLVRGTQTIQIEMTDATADSGVVMAYRRRWLRR